MDAQQDSTEDPVPHLVDAAEPDVKQAIPESGCRASGYVGNGTGPLRPLGAAAVAADFLVMRVRMLW